MTRLKSLLMAGALASAVLAPGPVSAAQTIYVYNWANYIGADTLKNFTKETGIEVVYDTYDSSETVQAKLMAGSTGYDVIIHSASSYGPTDIEAGMFHKLDKSKLPNLENLDPSIVKRYEAYDPGMQYGMPYLWGTTGFTYNVDLVKKRVPDAPLDSLAMLFDPKIVSKLKDCGVSFLDSPEDVMPMALSYLGLNPNSREPGDYKKAAAMLSKIRPYVRTFDNSNYLTALPQQSVCVAMTWSGDYATATANAEADKIDVKLAYTIPKEGSALWFDAAFIPSDAKNVDGAMQFLNYLQRPDVMAGITEVTNYANVNIKSTPLLPKEIVENPANYPDEAAMKLTFGKETLPAKVTKAQTRAFSDFKTAR